MRPLTYSNLLRCPACFSAVVQNANELMCTNESCRAAYPFVNDIPILINEKESVFRVEDFTSGEFSFFKVRTGFSTWLNKVIPSVSHNMAARENFQLVRKHVLNGRPSGTVLIIGGGIIGEGFEVLIGDKNLNLIETDVSFGPRTMMICDAHHLPFQTGSFDAVVVQAVLEHVVDPNRCVNEIFRVLNHNGIVYAETPFMQQIHGGNYDFQRFTFRGHRRLFRGFTEIRAGITGGPGMALAWAWQYFLSSFSDNPTIRMVLGGVGRISSFYFKYFDHLLKHYPGTYDAASGYYFLGRKSNLVLDDKELINTYRPSELGPRR